MEVFTQVFLGMLAAGGVLAALAKFFGAEFIKHQFSKALADHEHELSVKRANLQNEMAQIGDVVSRRNAHEFQVTEGAWARMVAAIDVTRREFAGNIPDVIFRPLSEAEALRAIDQLSFSSEEKEALVAAAANDRQGLYGEMSFAYGLRRVLNAWSDFHNWLSERQIFLEPPIYARFEEIADHLYGAIASTPSRFERDPEVRKRDRIGAYRALDGLEEKRRELEVLIQRRFQFEERPRAQ